MATCARLSCILSFRVHVKLCYRIVSYPVLPRLILLWEFCYCYFHHVIFSVFCTLRPGRWRRPVAPAGCRWQQAADAGPQRCVSTTAVSLWGRRQRRHCHRYITSLYNDL